MEQWDYFKEKGTLGFILQLCSDIFFSFYQKRHPILAKEIWFFPERWSCIKMQLPLCWAGTEIQPTWLSSLVFNFLCFLTTKSAWCLFSLLRSHCCAVMNQLLECKCYHQRPGWRFVRLAEVITSKITDSAKCLSCSQVAASRSWESLKLLPAECPLIAVGSCTALPRKNSGSFCTCWRQEKKE